MTGSLPRPKAALRFRQFVNFKSDKFVHPAASSCIVWLDDLSRVAQQGRDADKKYAAKIDGTDAAGEKRNYGENRTFLMSSKRCTCCSESA
jgi:hypothetical protein